MLAELEYYEFFCRDVSKISSLRKETIYLVELWKSQVHEFKRIVYCCLLYTGYSSHLDKKLHKIRNL